MPDPTNRNWLTALIALQRDLVSQEQLLLAMNSWGENKDEPIEQVLVKLQMISNDSFHLLQELVSKELAVQSTGLGTTFPNQSTAKVADKEGRSLVETEIHMNHEGRPISMGQSSAVRFRLIHRHAKGGLGEVFLARDTELNRNVAIKQIQSQFAGSSDFQSRFILEAEVTGGLEHPGIVPVYGLGLHSDGTPFYAMRFIEGESLKEVIEQFHRKSSAETVETSSHLAVEFRKLLARFITVCDAVEFAHSRGVLHRDLKPSNIMLGNYGETLVVDWGLAKLLQSKEGSTESKAGTDRSGNGSSHTLDGSVMGTLAYMSPEQARGNHHELGPESDVYSLGATLYHILTGVPPIVAENTAEAQRRIFSGDFQKPREVRRKIATPLEAVCLKAMSINASHRYSSCRELSKDIELWLADEPVSAYRDPWQKRLGRMLRRNRIRVIALVALSATLLSLGMWQYEQRRSNELDRLRGAAVVQRDQAKQLQQLAEDNGREAEIQKARSEAIQYNGDMKLAYQSWFEGNPVAALSILDNHGSKRAYANDFRGVEWNLLWKMFHPPVSVIDHLEKTPWAISFSNDGLRVATCIRGDLVQIFDAHSTKLIAELVTQGPLEFVEFSSDSKWIVAGRQGSLVIWDGVTYELKSSHTFEGRLVSMSLRPGSTEVFLTTAHKGSGRLRVWDFLKDEEVHSSEFFGAVSVSPDGKLIAMASATPNANDGFTKIRIRNWDEQKEVFEHDWRGDPRRTLMFSPKMRFSPDSKYLFAAFDTPSICAWEIATGEEVLQFLLKEGVVHPNSNVTISNDCKWVAQNGGDLQVRIWDTSTGKLSRAFVGHTDMMLGLAFNPMGTHVASSGGDNTIRIWDMQQDPEGESVTPKQRIHDFDYTQSDDLLAIGSDRDVSIWHRKNKEPLHRFSIDGPGYAQSVSIHPSGRFVGGATFKKAWVWDATTGENAFTIHGAAHSRIAFSHDGNSFACFGPQNAIRVFDMNGDEKIVLESNSAFGNVSSADLRFSPDDTHLASATLREVKVWNLANREEVLGMVVFSQGTTRCAFSEDGRLFACPGSEPSSIETYDMKTLVKLMTLRGHVGGTVHSLAFLPGGKRLISGGRDSTVRIWDLTTGRETLGFNVMGCSKLALSEDGHFLITGRPDDGRINFLNIEPSNALEESL